MATRDEVEITSTISIPVTPDSLPTGNWWEIDDDACWEAIIDPSEPAGWRWQPKNWLAFRKIHPTGEMVDYLPFRPDREKL